MFPYISELYRNWEQIKIGKVQLLLTEKYVSIDGLVLPCIIFNLERSFSKILFYKHWIKYDGFISNILCYGFISNILCYTYLPSSNDKNVILESNVLNSKFVTCQLKIFARLILKRQFCLSRYFWMKRIINIAYELPN